MKHCVQAFVRGVDVSAFLYQILCHVVISIFSRDVKSASSAGRFIDALQENINDCAKFRQSRSSDTAVDLSAAFKQVAWPALRDNN